jgi:hypothetical protein
VSLERGVSNVPNCKSFLVTEARKEACQAMYAISTTSRRELLSSFFFLQGKVPKEIHDILTETLEEHVPSYATVKN